MITELAPTRPLDIRIHYSIYQQDGTMQAMEMPDTPSNRLFAVWLRKFDRYSGNGDPT